MVQVAEVVGVHETTVSRAVSGKYMQTPHGIFEMKYFFTSGIKTANGVGMSNTSRQGHDLRYDQGGSTRQTAFRRGNREDACAKRASSSPAAPSPSTGRS